MSARKRAVKTGGPWYLVWFPDEEAEVYHDLTGAKNAVEVWVNRPRFNTEEGPEFSDEESLPCIYVAERKVPWKVTVRVDWESGT